MRLPRALHQQWHPTPLHHTPLTRAEQGGGEKKSVHHGDG
jgi:hypothetical protein